MQAFLYKKRVFYVIYRAVFHFDHVEAAFSVCFARTEQIRLRGQSVFFSFFRIDSLGRLAESRRAAAFHLREYQHLPVESDYIDFAVSRPVIARGDAKPQPLQIFYGEVFSCFSVYFFIKVFLCI